MDDYTIYCVMSKSGRVEYICTEEQYNHYFADVPGRLRPEFTSFRTWQEAEKFKKEQNKRINK